MYTFCKLLVKQTIVCFQEVFLRVMNYFIIETEKLQSVNIFEFPQNYPDLSPADKSASFCYPQLSKNAQNIRNPVPF